MGLDDLDDYVFERFDEVDAKKHSRYEKAVVERIIARCGLAYLREDLDEYARQHDNGAITFVALCDVARFPLWLVNGKDLQAVWREELGKAFTKSRFYLEWRDAADSPPEGLDQSVMTGIVFPSQGAKFRVFYQRNSLNPAPGFRHNWTHQGQQFWLEDLDQLLVSLGDPEGW